MLGDLHCHSRFSDGSASIEQIISYAKRACLDYISITDHDTVAGVPLALELGEKAGIGVIPGVECSCRDKSRDRAVHLLCYNPKDFETLERELSKTLESRRQQKLEIIELLKAEYSITKEDVLKFQGESMSIYECHIMQAIANMGYTNTIIDSLMYELMGSEGKYAVPTKYADVYETVKLIKAVGGVTVIAHPEEYNSFELTQELSEKKLIDGIEVFHPRNSQNARIKLLELSKKYNLLITGGSDFHGQFQRKPNPLGTCTIDNEAVIKMLQL